MGAADFSLSANGALLPSASKDQLHARILELEKENTRLRRTSLAATLNFDFQTGKFSWDDLCSDLLGLPQDPPPSAEQLEALIHPDDLNRYHASFPALKDPDRADVYNATFRIVRHDDGETRTIAISGNVTFDGRQPSHLHAAIHDVTDEIAASKKLAEVAVDLADSERRREAAIAAGKVGIWKHDISSQTLFWDSTASEAFGMGKREQKIACSDFGRIIHSDDLQKHNAFVEAALAAAGESDFHATYRVLRADTGEERWIDEVGRSEYENGLPVALTGTVRDVTDSVTNHNYSEIQSNRLAVALESGGLGAWEYVAELDGSIWDPKCFELVGMAPKPIVMMDEYVTLIHPEDRDAFIADVEAALDPDGSGVHEMRYRISHSGLDRDIWLKARGKAIFENRKPVRMVGTIEDVTKDIDSRNRLMSLTRQLTESEALRVLATEAGRIGVWEANPREGTAFWDRICLTHFGIPGERREVSFSQIAEFIHPDDRAAYQAAISAALEPDGPPADATIHRIIHADTGEVRWLETAMQASVLEDALVKLVGTVRDVTREKASADHLALMNRELHHRVKNLFGTLKGLVRMSAREFPGTDDYVTALSGRLDALSAAHLISMDRNNRAPVQLRGLVEAVLHPYIRENENRIFISGEDMTISPDAVPHIGVILHELATNAVKYGALSDRGTRLSVEIRPDATPDAPRRAELTWREVANLPAMTTMQPSKGFGTRLITSSARGMGSDYQPVWMPQGFSVTFQIPSA